MISKKGQPNTHLTFFMKTFSNLIVYINNAIILLGSFYVEVTRTDCKIQILRIERKTNIQWTRE